MNFGWKMLSQCLLALFNIKFFLSFYESGVFFVLFSSLSLSIHSHNEIFLGTNKTFKLNFIIRTKFSFRSSAWGQMEEWGLQRLCVAGGGELTYLTWVRVLIQCKICNSQRGGKAIRIPKREKFLSPLDTFKQQIFTIYRIYIVIILS